jgi:acyl-CoA reductase-like NAD-dependent aldehyde dehydrogenase
MSGAVAAVPSIDETIAALKQGEVTWAALPLPGRRKLLERLRDLTIETRR